MPGERKESKMSQSFRRIVDHMDGGEDKKYIWGCSLQEETKVVTWDHTEEDDDEDFVVHTLELKHATLGKGAKQGERNIIELETKTFEGETLTCPIATLTCGGTENIAFDLTFTNEIPVTFRLAEGSGPVHLAAQHLVEFPESDSEDECDETEADTADESEMVDARQIIKAMRKRKSSQGSSGGGRAKKPKKSVNTDASTAESAADEEDDEEVDSDEEEGDEMDTGAESDTKYKMAEDEEEEDDEEEDEDEEEDDEEEEEEEEEEEPSPEPVKPKKKKNKDAEIKKLKKKAAGKVKKANGKVATA